MADEHDANGVPTLLFPHRHQSLAQSGRLPQYAHVVDEGRAFIAIAIDRNRRYAVALGAVEQRMVRHVEII